MKIPSVLAQSRRPLRWPWLLRSLGLALSLALGCKPYQELSDHPCPPQGTPLTYSNFGAPFLDRYCQSCHGSAALDRRGAPGDFLFDTREQVSRQRDRIFVRSAAGNDTMPPGPSDPPLAERDQLADWLACGAP